MKMLRSVWPGAEESAFAQAEIIPLVEDRGKRISKYFLKDLMKYAEWCIIERLYVNYNNCNFEDEVK